MTIKELTSTVERLKGQKLSLQRRLDEACMKSEQAQLEVKATEEAVGIIQLIASRTQDQIRYHITDLGSTALEAIFDTEIGLNLEFEEKRGKTEATLSFSREGQKIEPLESDSGGAVDIASFALRCSLMSLQKPRLRPLMVLDEPFKNINDSSREMQRKAAEMVSEISKKLGIQFIIVTMLPEFEETADKVFKIT